ncbi:hypothetical protein [Sulfurimonas paralvinellae]|uniref:hypothetical protein n=1 Tax=Sulfurimonas paralvinellae TaxID=317658 RepID=UPI0018681529|nr:hypothetical protein [Sulfurimonas paralvinellae]
MTLSNAKTVQDVQVFTTENKDHKVTPKSIEAAFEAVGLSIAGNNDMNIPFSKRFGKLHYKIYNLAMFSNDELTFKLIKKYPGFGALTPLTMSIWEDTDGSINISTLNFNGMARATQIPSNDPDLRSYAALVHKALRKAMPQGHFKKLFFKPTHQGKPLQVNFTADVELEDDTTIDDFIDDFEAEFEGEMEPLGFLFPNYTNLQEELFEDNDYDAYDFYHTYSICKFDVIYPVSKFHPEAGAWAPCSFYIYKKKGENKMHMGFLGVENWITTLDIHDRASINALKEAQGMIKKILQEQTD